MFDDVIQEMKQDEVNRFVKENGDLLSGISEIMSLIFDGSVDRISKAIAIMGIFSANNIMENAEGRLTIEETVAALNINEAVIGNLMSGILFAAGAFALQTNAQGGADVQRDMIASNVVHILRTIINNPIDIPDDPGFVEAIIESLVDSDIADAVTEGAAEVFDIEVDTVRATTDSAMRWYRNQSARVVDLLRVANVERNQSAEAVKG